MSTTEGTHPVKYYLPLLMLLVLVPTSGCYWISGPWLGPDHIRDKYEDDIQVGMLVEDLENKLGKPSEIIWDRDPDGRIPGQPRRMVGLQVRLPGQRTARHPGSGRLRGHRHREAPCRYGAGRTAPTHQTDRTRGRLSRRAAQAVQGPGEREEARLLGSPRGRPAATRRGPAGIARRDTEGPFRRTRSGPSTFRPIPGTRRSRRRAEVGGG